MKKLLVCLLFCCQILDAQNRPCRCEVNIDYDYDGFIDLYNNSETSFVFAKIRNNVIEDECVGIEILEDCGSRFRVNMHLRDVGLSFRMEDVYIYKEHLITLARPIDYPMPLYSQPSLSSKIVASIENAYGYKYDVLDCFDDWLKVTFVDDENHRHTGWMAKKFQCSNVYNACMGG